MVMAVSGQIQLFLVQKFHQVVYPRHRQLHLHTLRRAGGVLELLEVEQPVEDDMSVWVDGHRCRRRC